MSDWINRRVAARIPGEGPEESLLPPKPKNPCPGAGRAVSSQATFGGDKSGPQAKCPHCGRNA